MSTDINVLSQPLPVPPVASAPSPGEDKVITATADSKIQLRWLLFVVLGLVMGYYVVTNVWQFGVAPDEIEPYFGGFPTRGAFDKQTPDPTATELVFGQELFTLPTYTPYPTYTPFPLPPTDTPTPHVVTVMQDRYIDVPVQIEVTRVVTQVVYIEPTVTPTMLPGISVKVCVYGEGLTGIFVAEIGLPGNTCMMVPLQSPVNDIRIRITK